MLPALVRKWLNRPKKSDTRLLSQFFFVDEEATRLLSKLLYLDVRRNIRRYLSLLNTLHTAQERMLELIARISEQCIPQQLHRREYQIKFPEDYLSDNVNTHLLFAAELIVSGTYVEVEEGDGVRLSPLATEFLYSLAELRTVLREQCLRDPSTYSEPIKEALIKFDSISAEFELRYVSLVSVIKTPEEIFMKQEIIVLFCETIARALKLGYLTQDMIDVCEPLLMFTIPRLSIVSGLLIYPDGPLNLQKRPEEMSKLFRPFYGLLKKIRDLLVVLSEEELVALEKSLCSADSDDRHPDLSCFDEPQQVVTSLHYTQADVTGIAELPPDLIDIYQPHLDLTGLAISAESRSSSILSQPLVTNVGLQELVKLDCSTQQVAMGTPQHTDTLESRHFAFSSVTAHPQNEAFVPKTLIQASKPGGLQVDEGEGLRPREQENMQCVFSFEDEEEEERTSYASSCTPGHLYGELILPTYATQLHPGALREVVGPVCQKGSQEMVFPVHHSSQVEVFSINKDVPLQTVSSIQDGSPQASFNNPIPLGHHMEPRNQSTPDRASLPAYIPSPSLCSAELHRPSQDECSQLLKSSQSLVSGIYPKRHQSEFSLCHDIPLNAGSEPQDSESPLQHGTPRVSASLRSQSIPEMSASVMDSEGSWVSGSPVHPRTARSSTSLMHSEFFQGSVSPMHPTIPHISTLPMLPVVHQASASPMHLGGLLVSTAPMHTGEYRVCTSSLRPPLPHVLASSMVAADSASSGLPEEYTYCKDRVPGVSPSRVHRECPQSVSQYLSSATYRGVSQNSASKIQKGVSWDSSSTMHQGLSQDSESTMHQGLSQVSESTMHQGLSQVSESTMHQGLSQETTMHQALSRDSESTMHQGPSQESTMHQALSRDSESTMHQALSWDSEAPTHQGLSQDSESTMHQGLSQDSESTTHQGLSQDSESTMHQKLSQDSQSTMHQELSQDSQSTMPQALSRGSESTMHQALSQDSESAMHPWVSQGFSSTMHHGLSLDSTTHLSQDSASTLHVGVSQIPVSKINQNLPLVCASPSHQAVTLFSVSAMDRDMPEVVTCTTYHAVPQVVDFKLLQEVHQDFASTVQQSEPCESADPMPLGMSPVLTSPIHHLGTPQVSGSPLECVSHQDSASTLHHGGGPLFPSPVHTGFPQDSVSPLSHRDLENYPLSLPLCCGPTAETVSMLYDSLLEPDAPEHPHTPPWIDDSCMLSRSVLGGGSVVPGPTASGNSVRPRRAVLQARDVVGSRSDAGHCRTRVPRPPIASHLIRHEGQTPRHMEEPQRRRLRDARELINVEIRSRYRSSSDMLHRLFVCIAGVADQLQTNFASDLRPILQTVFELTASKSEAADVPNPEQAEEALSHRPEGSSQNPLEDCALCLGVNPCTTGSAEGDPSLNEPPVWLPDRATSICMDCRAAFTLIRRRHHCRSCGKIFCYRCSSHIVPLPHFGYSKAVRVCNHCLTTHLPSRHSELP